MAAPMVSDKMLLMKIRSFAIISRLVLILLQFLFNFILPDHDAGVFNPPQQNHTAVSDQAVAFLIGGFRRWDAVYFTHVVEHGYTYENTLAFFPLFPMLVKFTACIIFFPLHLFMSSSSVIIISAIVINVYLFMKTAENLYRLGILVTCNDVISYKAALLFCINPASVFMSAPYSETTYAYFTVTGLLNFEEDKNISASVFFALSCVTRVNGVLNLGYLTYKLFKKGLCTLKKLGNEILVNKAVILTAPWMFVRTIVPYSVLTVLSLLPFIMYQFYCYQLYCRHEYRLHISEHLEQYGRTEGLKLAGDEPSPWCNTSIPLAYSYVQTEYWDQGMFRYWKLKQIPNFLLATPVTVLVVLLSSSYYKHNRYICLSLGLDEAGAVKKGTQITPYFQLEGVTLLPYVIHALLLTVFGWFFIHVQVLTRLMFSSLPVLYWYSAHLVSGGIRRQQHYKKYDMSKCPQIQVERPENIRNDHQNLLIDQISNFTNQSITTKCILAYFITYFVIGVAMFSNFLPWT